MSEQPLNPKALERIRGFDLTCLRTPTAPCRSRDHHPQYSPLTVSEWCEHCVIASLLRHVSALEQQRDDQAARTKAALTEATLAFESEQRFKQATIRAESDRDALAAELRTLRDIIKQKPWCEHCGRQCAVVCQDCHEVLRHAQ